MNCSRWVNGMTSVSWRRWKTMMNSQTINAQTDATTMIDRSPQSPLQRPAMQIAINTVVLIINNDVSNPTSTNRKTAVNGERDATPIGIPCMEFNELGDY